MRVLQGNIRRSTVADDLLVQLKHEKKVDILLLSEQYKNREQGWYADNLGTAAIWVTDLSKYPVSQQGYGDGFVWVEINGVTYVSCYFTPNESIADFVTKLHYLEDTLQEMKTNLVVAGDFNARAVEWGMPQTDSRGQKILDMASRLELIVLNEGNTPTFRRPGYTQTIPDVSFATEDIAAQVSNWKVMEDYTASDHQYITFSVREECRIRNIPKPTRWNSATMDAEKLYNIIQQGMAAIINEHAKSSTASEATSRVAATMKLIHRACSASMKRRKPRNNRQPAYWWTPEIALLRKECLRSRRKAQRAKGRNETDILAARYKAARKDLRNAIKRSKISKWQALIEDIERDPWGLGYKIVCKKIRGMSSPALDASTMEEIVNSLFPKHPEVKVSENHIETDVPMFHERELLLAVNSLKDGKAPGPDGIPTEALKVIVKDFPGLLLGMYNDCLKAGIFPPCWKRARLVLIHKGKTAANLASAYRPLCMLDSAGKILEKLLQPRILSAVKSAGNLSAHQRGFCKGHSTLGSID